MPKKSVKVRIDEDEIEDLDEEAEEEGLSRSAYIRRILKNRHGGPQQDRVDELEARMEQVETVLDHLDVDVPTPESH